MATVLEECTTEEQHSVVDNLWVKGLNAKDIHKEMFLVYGGKCLSCKVVHNWVKKFSQGHLEVRDDARPVHHVEIVTETTVQQVEELIQADRRITIDSVATALGCSQNKKLTIHLH
jgi:transposase